VHLAVRIITILVLTVRLLPAMFATMLTQTCVVLRNHMLNGMRMHLGVLRTQMDAVSLNLLVATKVRLLVYMRPSTCMHGCVHLYARVLTQVPQLIIVVQMVLCTVHINLISDQRIVRPQLLCPGA